MKYTNNYNLPPHICRWLEQDSYDYNPEVLSATTLIGPARAWALKRQHADDLTLDYSDLIALRYGTAIHDSLEKAGALDSDAIIEKRYCAEFMGFVVTGKPDAVIDGTLRDNKSTSVWKFVKHEFDDYIKQLSIYRWLLAKNGIFVTEFAFIDFFFTDWKRSDAAKGGGYPPVRYQEQRIELWSVEATEHYIAKRIEEFAFADCALPWCSPEELWMPPKQYAVYRLNKDNSRQARAFRCCASREEAEKVLSTLPSGEIEERIGKAKRCAYCTAAPFCDQFDDLKSKGLADEQ